MGNITLSSLQGLGLIRVFLLRARKAGRDFARCSAGQLAPVLKAHFLLGIVPDVAGCAGQRRVARRAVAKRLAKLPQRDNAPNPRGLMVGPRPPLLLRAPML